MPAAGQFVLASDFTAAKAAQESTAHNNLSSATFAAGSPECGTTFTAPTSGAVQIAVAARFNNDADTTACLRFSAQVYLGTSSAGTLFDDGTADSAKIAENASPGASDVTTTAQWVVSGLTAAATYYVRTAHAVTAGTGIDLVLRQVWAYPIPGGV